MIALYIIVGIVWLLTGYYFTSKICREDDDAPPLFIVIFMIAMGPILPIFIKLIDWIVDFCFWVSKKTNFNTEKYIRKFLRLKEK